MKVHIRTYGCRANRYDSELVREMVTGAGHEIAESAEHADIAVFNSCAVTAAAEADLRKGIRKAARENPALHSIVMGCAAARSAEALLKLPSVASVIPGADLSGIATSIGIPLTTNIVTRRQSGARAFLRIQDGCDEHCTFCATTLARGAAVSRPLDALIAEASRLSRHHAEIVITGIHIGHYGRDTGSSLGELAALLIDRIPDARFRLSSVEATEVDPLLGALLRRDDERLAPHVHAPLQSGSDRILKLMGRHWYTADTYRRAVEQLLDGATAFALGADIICGFPGESDSDHASTAMLVRDLPFTYLHVFPYSERPGTAAVRLHDRVPSRVTLERCAELREIAGAKSAEYAGSRSGGRASVVVISEGGKREGLTGDYLKVCLADGTIPRGELFHARLRLAGDRLIAERAGYP